MFKVFLEDILRKASKELILLKRAGKKFRSTLKVSWWYEEEKKGKQWLWIGCDAGLQVSYKGIKSFGAAFLLYDKLGKYDVVAYVTDIDNTWRDDMFYYPRKDLEFLKFENEAIKYWSRKLK